MSSQGSPTLPRWTPSPIPAAPGGPFDSASEKISKNKVDEVDEAHNKLAIVRETLDQLRRWHGWGVRRQQFIKWYLLSIIYPVRPSRPSHSKLRELALFFFPPRATGVKVEICDYGQAWYEQAGRDLSCEAVSLRDKQYLQDQLDVFNILRDVDSLMDNLNIPTRMQTSMDSTAAKFDLGTTFWHLSLTDIPWQLGEGSRTSLLDTDLGVNPASTVIQDQFLSRHPAYENTVLVRSLFQCYYREGTAYLDRDRLQEIQLRPGTRAARDETSFLGYFMKNYAHSGTEHWPIKSTTWFVVEMLTQLLVTPHRSSSGTPVPDMQSAYTPSVRDLKDRRGTQFKRNESVNLVREYVSCMDEISQIYGIAQRKLEFLERLRRDFEGIRTAPTATDVLAEYIDNLGERSPPAADTQTCDVAIKTIEYAIGRIKAQHEALPGILDDLRSSLHDLFQLRTIEQNELAIIAESNNKAILVFTVVTIVFLPLSFFTSYFGMNVENTAALLSSQGYFWSVCGSVTLFIVVFTLIYGFKDRLYGWLWGDRHPPRGAEFYYRADRH
ncbi:MAG: hypothetical protein Q9207_006790 [Kuettlingeria erythrocarpa]